MKRFILLAFAGTLGLAACADQPVGPAGLPDLASASAKSEGGKTTHRSLQEFLAAQGTFCVNDNPVCQPLFAPVPELFGWADFALQTTFAMVDYAGVADKWLQEQGGPSLGTTIDGTVSERVLKDGLAEIHVVLHFKNALAWAGGFDEFLRGEREPLFFGATAPQVLAGATPALASGTYQAKFIVSAPGLPLPDLVQVAFDPRPGEGDLQLTFHAQARGALHASSGYAEGTPGQLSIQQVGIFHTKSPVKANDPFPVESIKLRPIGR